MCVVLFYSSPHFIHLFCVTWIDWVRVLSVCLSRALSFLSFCQFSFVLLLFGSPFLLLRFFQPFPSRLISFILSHRIIMSSHGPGLAVPSLPPPSLSRCLSVQHTPHVPPFITPFMIDVVSSTVSFITPFMIDVVSSTVSQTAGFCEFVDPTNDPNSIHPFQFRGGAVIALAHRFFVSYVCCMSHQFFDYSFSFVCCCRSGTNYSLQTTNQSLLQRASKHKRQRHPTGAPAVSWIESFNKKKNIYSKILPSIACQNKKIIERCNKKYME